MISHTLIEITKNMGFIIFKNLKGVKNIVFIQMYKKQDDN